MAVKAALGLMMWLLFGLLGLAWGRLSAGGWRNQRFVFSGRFRPSQVWVSGWRFSSRQVYNFGIGWLSVWVIFMLAIWLFKFW